MTAVRTSADVNGTMGSLSAAMVPEDQQGRIVLVTDGVENEGSVSSMLDDLKARHIAVDVLPIQYEYEHEVWLERLDLPRQVKIGETYEATVLLDSLQPGDGKLVLRENGNVIAEQTVHYDKGKNSYALPLYFREPGYYEYVATIEPPPGSITVPRAEPAPTVSVAPVLVSVPSIAMVSVSLSNSASSAVV